MSKSTEVRGGSEGLAPPGCPEEGVPAWNRVRRVCGLEKSGASVVSVPKQTKASKSNRGQPEKGSERHTYARGYPAQMVPLSLSSYGHPSVITDLPSLPGSASSLVSEPQPLVLPPASFSWLTSNSIKSTGLRCCIVGWNVKCTLRAAALSRSRLDANSHTCIMRPRRAVPNPL